MSNWDGQERRKTMDKELQDFRVDVASFTAQVTEWMESTKQYRRELCEKIDRIDNQLSNHITEVTKKISELPCKERRVLLDNVDKNIKALWGAFTLIMISGIALGVWMRIITK